MRLTLLAVLILATVVAALATVGAFSLLRAQPRLPRIARVLLIAALASALVVGLLLLQPATDDSGAGFAAAVTLVPVVATLAPVLVLRLHRLAGTVTAWIAALVMFGYTLLFALGFGMFYLPTAVLLLTAGAVLTASSPQLRDAGDAASGAQQDHQG